MSSFKAALIELEHGLAPASAPQAQEGAAAQRGAHSPEGFLLDGYDLADGRRLEWDWRREKLALVRQDGERHELEALQAQAAKLERDIRLALAAFLVH
jgi:hypothetical protein